MIYLENYSNFMSKGILIPIGGSEKRGSDIDINNSILSDVVKNSKFGIESNIIIIPTASSYQSEINSVYVNTFKKIGCKNIKTLFISSVDQVDSDYNLDLLNKSNIVMFSGGDQSRISECFLGTKFIKMIKNKFNSDHFVVAGTSAGAMCMSENMITGGSKRVKCGIGLSLIPSLIIDSHFTERNRHNRLLEAVSIYPNRIGVGLSEDTAIIIKNNKFKVIGSGSVTIYNPYNLDKNSSLNDLKFKVLSSGDTFDIQTCFDGQ
jgi:cyanophycinase